MSEYYRAKRTKNIYIPDSSEPFKLSRSKIDLFLNCPRCFYLDRRLGVGQPPGYPFNLNSAVDELLKKEFDIHRAKNIAHPLMKSFNIDAVPYSHEKMDEWRDSLRRGVTFLHKPTNLLITGGVDDVWIDNKTKELIVVDYKATSKDGEVGLDAEWQIGYKRQMEIYQWLFRQNGFKVSNTGYFVYCNGRRDNESFDARLDFDIKLIPYKGDDSWVEKTILDVHACLNSDSIPDMSPECDYCKYSTALKVIDDTQDGSSSEEDDYYNNIESERDKYTTKVLSSNHPKKIIIAGPGTGKSFLFQEICKNNISKNKNNNIALSFINELVEDLAIDLHGLADTKTLHGFARGKFKGDKKVFTQLPKIISEDYKITSNKDVDFDVAFRDPDNYKEELKYYVKRANYYNFYCPGCLLYMLTSFYQKYPDKIPCFSQVLVDEFQDFNTLETRLIDLLSQKSPILLVGDDDQSLYSWKDAYPEEIRKRSNDGSYERHELPYCSRCTKVLVNAFNSFITQAQKNGFLKNRVPKDYIYFPSKDKDKVSEDHNNITVKTNINQVSVAYHIDQEIKRLFGPKENPRILIICSIASQINRLVKNLRTKGYVNIKTRAYNPIEPLLEAFKLLTEDSNCNLGWRIISKCLLSDNDFKKAIFTSNTKQDKFSNLLTKEVRKNIKDLNKVFKKISKDETLNAQDKAFIDDHCGELFFELSKKDVRDYLNKAIPFKNSHKNFNIRVTNILGSKGLSYDYVFLVNFDDKYLIGKEINDEKICNFLVALTRAKKGVTVFTSQDKLPTFFDWIDTSYIEQIG